MTLALKKVYVLLLQTDIVVNEQRCLITDLSDAEPFANGIVNEKMKLKDLHNVQNKILHVSMMENVVTQ